MMELKDTIELMESADYKDRFKAEFYQLVIRYKKLNKMFVNWDNLDFTPTCPKDTFMMQLRAMYDYIVVLKARAEFEHIELEIDI